MSAHAELSSASTVLDELIARITAIGEGLSGAEREALSSELWEVERALGSAQRRLTRVVDASRR
jgi:hypothetical protein